jgi:outer membrane protein assembly factor BamB
VWDDKVFLTGGDRRTREVYCFLGKDGRLLWRYAVQPATSTSTLAVTDDTGYAAPSPATDGRHVFAVFATGDLVCLDFQGRRIWGRNLGLPDNPYGHGSSLLVWKDLLLVQYDHGGGNRVMAIRSATGETVWQTPRPGEVSWCSPVLAGPSSPPVLLLNGNPFLTAYAVETWQELWKQECMCGEVATSPAVSQGRVFAANENACLVACDLTTGRVLWESDLDLPDVSSPLAVDGLLIMASSGGVVTCYDGAGGEVLWLHEFDKGFYGSPVLAGGRVYVVDRIGVTRIFMAAKSFSLTGSPALGEPSDGTPAFVGGRIYLRGRDHLFCLGEAP